MARDEFDRPSSSLRDKKAGETAVSWRTRQIVISPNLLSLELGA